VYSAIELILLFVFVAALIAGGIMSLRVRPQGQNLLVNTFVLAIPLELVQAVCSALDCFGRGLDSFAAWILFGGVDLFAQTRSAGEVRVLITEQLVNFVQAFLEGECRVRVRCLHLA
jgi:hypothetical protein